MKWLRGGYRADAHSHRSAVHWHLHHAERHAHIRIGRQALAIGMLTAVGGTGTVGLLLIAGLPDRLAAVSALAVYDPMGWSLWRSAPGAYTWVLTLRVIQSLYRRLVVPALAAFSLLFGVWHTGVA